MAAFDEEEDKEKYNFGDELHLAIHSQQFIYITYNR